MQLFSLHKKKSTWKKRTRKIIFSVLVIISGRSVNLSSGSTISSASNIIGRKLRGRLMFPLKRRCKCRLGPSSITRLQSRWLYWLLQQCIRCLLSVRIDCPHSSFNLRIVRIMWITVTRRESIDMHSVSLSSSDVFDYRNDLRFKRDDLERTSPRSS